MLPEMTNVGPYRVTRPLGRGGMGAVYLAHDTRLDREVALKLFSGPEATSATAREQVMAEARAAASINHPHIAAVHDVLEVDGQVAIVFEYVQGETLAERLRRGRLMPDETVRIALQLTDALTAAHNHGIIHRDLKPANIALTSNGVVKVLDFGVARVMPSEPDAVDGAVTTVAGFVGTLGYAAPEQCLGQSADARADVFSLGVVLYEMLTLRRPFAGTDAVSVMQAMLAAEPPRVRTLHPEVPAELDGLIARMLASDAAKRPASAQQVRDVLQSLAPTNLGRAGALSAKPRRWIAALLVAAAITAGLLGPMVWRRSPAPADGPPVVAVLPLTNATGDQGNDYVALGVADSLITRLAALPSVTVLSRSAVADPRLRKSNLGALARELDASYLVDGSVQQAADQLRISLSLVRSDGSVAWADTVEGPFTSIFDLQTRLASALGQALAVQLSAADRASLAEQPTMSAAALAAYWRGRALLDRRDVAGNLDAAIASFEEAARLDPRYAAAHAARGEALWSRYLGTRSADDARAATEAGTTALRLDPDSPEVRYTLAVTLAGSGQLDAALEELQRALALRPNFEDARIELGSILARMGKTDEALAEFRAVSAVRPNYAAPHDAMGLSLYEAGRFAEAAAAFERVTALQPDNAVAHQRVGVAYQALGDNDNALKWYDKALSIRPYPQAYSNIGAIHHQRGEYARAVEAYRKAIDLRPNARETHRNLGDAYSKMGRTADAQQAYRRAIALTEEDLRVNPRDARTLASLALYLQKAGSGQQALNRLGEALKIGPTDFEVLRRAAQVHALAGRTEAALDALEAALRQGLRRETARGEDEFESLRGSERFAALTAQPQ
jgi:tetratricopeptide (TPR) repeat protein/tRNA A-37 threonylcarbamoyl transferase component Bud32